MKTINYIIEDLEIKISVAKDQIKRFEKEKDHKRKEFQRGKLRAHKETLWTIKQAIK